MNSGFGIGRIFGISLRIDWSWLFIFLLVTWNLALGFGQLHPSWGPGLQWGTALAAAVLFFASVLAHELAHSLVAKAKGINVRSITLWLFGGVTDIQRHPPSAGAEFLIAVLGPLTSIALGALFLWLSGVTASLAPAVASDPAGTIARLDPVTTLLLWLGPINIVLGVFNLIPGFPLDGGRILRSILWGLTDNLRRATFWAATVGHVVAWLMIAAGIAMAIGVRLPVLGTGLVSGLWLAFIGWFLNSAASQSYQQVAVQDLLEGVPVSSLMRTDPPTAEPDLPVSDLVHERVMRTDDHAFPVMEGDRLVGLVTLDDVRRVPRDRWDRVRVREIMTPADRLVAVTPTEDATEALDKLRERDVRQLPVRKNGQLVGLLRRRDIVRWLQVQSGSR